MNTPVFELVGVTDDETSPALLGLWSAAAPEPVSFSTDTTAPPMPVWRVNIPDDEDEAERMLAEGERQLAAAQRKLNSVTARLDSLAQYKATAEAVSFSTEAPPVTLNPADQFLLEELQQAESGAVSFGLTDEIGPALEKIRQAVMFYAAAETAQQETVLGRTTISWTGDADTVWASHSSKRQVKLHRRTVRLALASKDTNIRLLFLTVQSAAKIAATLSGGITAAAAIPIAWNYIRQVLAELEQLNTVKQTD